MPSTVTAVFSEPQALEASLRTEGFLGLATTAHGQFRAELTQITLDKLRLSAAEETLPRIAFIAASTDMVLLSLPIDSAGAMLCGGVRLTATELLTVCKGRRFHFRTSGRSHWGVIQLPLGTLVKYGVVLTGTQFPTSPMVQRWRPARASSRQLRQLHSAAIQLAAKRRQALVDAESAHVLEQQLLHAVADCLSNESACQISRAERRGQNVMVAFEELLQRQPSEKPSMSEICAELDVSERHLRQLCSLHLGMSPTSYNQLLRMSLARQALQRGDPALDSVSAIARDVGFRDFGRFAVNYRVLFGESPSTTLYDR
jgi:AraC-like DNA-binding protein